MESRRHGMVLQDKRHALLAFKVAGNVCVGIYGCYCSYLILWHYRLVLHDRRVGFAGRAAGSDDLLSWWTSQRSAWRRWRRRRRAETALSNCEDTAQCGSVVAACVMAWTPADDQTGIVLCECCLVFQFRKLLKTWNYLHILRTQQLTVTAHCSVI